MRNSTTAHTYRIPAILTLIAIAAILAFSAVITVSAQSDDPDWRLPVTGLTVTTGDDAGELQITWNHHTQTTKTFLNYRVAWTPEGEDFRSADQTDWNAHPTSNQHTVTGLDAGATYQVKVRTRYEGRQGSRWTNIVTGQSGTPDWKLPVTGLTVTTGEASGELLIAWNHHPQTTKTFLNYRVAWTPQGEDFKRADQTDWNVFTTGNQHTVTGLDAGATYRVKVRTRYEGNQGSRWTDVVTGQSGGAPTNITPANAPATGQPTIAGTPEVGETLTAATSSISDDNGLADANFAYQWIRSADGSDAQIPGATGSTYLTSDEDLGHSIKVQVSFTDDDGYSETLTSDATATVPEPTSQNNAATGQPTVSGTAEVGETLTAGTSAISDDNGLTNATFNYQWIRSSDGTDTEISGATASSHLLSADDLQHTIKVSVSFTDDDGYSETLTSQATDVVVTTPNVAATGQPTIIGTAEVRETLTAGTSVIADANGLTNAVFSHQWVRRANGSDNDISGATGSTYVVTNADVDAAIRVRVSFTDDDGHSETLTSNATTSVPVPAPVIVPPEEPQIAQAAGDTQVPDDWNLIPTGKGIGDRFRLIFLSSTKRNATSSSISTYNTWIQTRAAAGHMALDDYSSLFKVVGCTNAVDARDNTGTTGTGVPIYWLNGNKVADNYADFYDETWDDEANDKNESGTNGPNTSDSDNYPATGCDHDGTKVSSRALGSSQSLVRVGRPNSSGAGNGPLSSPNSINTSGNPTRPMYGLSPVFIVVEFSDDAKLSALAIEGATNGESISLSPGFTANRGNYTATVPNNIDAVSLTATKNESNATVAITDDDDTNTKNQADLDLIVGDTTLTVTVTAQDGSTKTYTITVTRTTAITLVSNTGQTRANVAASIQSQPFTTGGNLGGYTLTSVDVGIQGDNVRTRLFHIVPNKGNGEPDLSDSTKFITLTTPGSTTADKIHTFTAPADAKLAANTTYHLHLANSDGGLPGNIHNVSSRAEDDGGAPGWSIGNTKYWRSSSTNDWSEDTTNIVRMQINGSNALPSTDATLSGLDLVHTSDGQSITLSPAFDAGTLTYTAEVAYGIDAVTLTATTNHSGAMVAITDDDDANTKETADLDLDGGANTLTLTVTAEDTATTETYTITVTRGSTDATLSGLTIVGATGGENITLSPAFVADTFTYAGAVANEIDAVTLTAATTHSNATVAITGDDTSTPNTAVLNLDVGANTLTVTVTAEDTATTETYTVTVKREPDPTEPVAVPVTWGLIPSGLSSGDQFRLLFLSSTRRNGASANITDYNTFVQGPAAAGHADIRAYSDGFTVVGCTEAVDARDNTGTTYTSMDKGVPIYWLDGAKVAADYEDFYDGSWDEETNDKNESGNDGPNTSFDGNYPLTGCSDDGTEKLSASVSSALGNGGDVTIARPNSSNSNHGPLSSNGKIDKTFTRPMYALSQIFTVTEPADCPSDATWCTAMRVKNTTTTTSIAKYDFSGYNISGPRGALGSTTFSHESTSYTVNRLEQTTLTALPADTISFRTFFLKAVPPLPAGTILKLGNRSFTVGADSEDSTVGQEQWNTLDNRLDWTNRQTVTVSLTLPDGGQTNHVPSNWSLKPNGLTGGDEFRLLFLSSTKRKATPSDIAVYNAWIQELVADGHADILAYSSGFTAVGCTEDTDARDNTSTTYTVTARGAPIYWLDGDLVAVDYADFYDGTWQDETNPKNESGTNGPDTSVSDNYPITGCNHDGTENVVSGISLALGTGGPVRVAVPDATDLGSGPLSSSSNLAAPTANRPMYGLSAVFIVTETSTDASLSGLDLVGTADGESITLSPDFDTGTFTYTAAVAHGIDEVTLTATKNEGNATVVITGDDNTRTQSEANLDLIVGPNTLTVAVTAADTSTTQTYTVTVIRADVQTDVHATWGLIPTGLGIGDRFRLIFFSSTNRDATSTSIDDYNTWIQDLAAVGHADIQAYSSGFRAVGCTEDDDARDNTSTQFNSANKGVPIYWLNGNKVADDYEDFYDGVWSNEGGLKKETGRPGPEPGFGFNWPWTGCDRFGTESTSGGSSYALGDPDSLGVRTGKLNSFHSAETPLSNNYLDTASDSRHMYGLSKVFNVVEGPDATLNDLALEDTALGESITLSPAFDTDTFTYGTTVGNSVDAVTLTATKKDSLATLVITNNDDPSTPDTAEFDLIVGSNTLTVTVTAVDATTETYTISVIRAEPPTDVHVAWGLIPTGLGIGDQFRLIFFSSTNRDALPTSIDDYNTWIQNLTAAGHDDIQAYSDGFRVVGCTQDDDARDNTGTRYNSADRGVPIYWLNGDKVADDYEDFYDGVWSNEGGLKKETGRPGPEPGFGFNWPWTGCNKDGTENISGGTSHALGDPDSSDVRTGKLNSFAGNETPLWNGSYTDDASDSRHMYGLSKVFNVMEFPDATLSTLAIKGATGSEIVDLSPTFAADTFTYTTSVPNEIDAVTLTVTKSESYDTVVITNDDDTGTPDTAEFDLIVGVNTLTVTVTAQGGTAKAYTVTLTRTPQTAPDAPTGLMATANGTSDINLEWTEPAYDGANAISGYKIQHSPTGNSPWTNLTGNTGNADTEYSDTGLDPRTTRHYRVFAINSIGTGPKSNIANATTDASPTPAQVTGVNVTPSNGALSVRWTAVSDATGYKVRWKSGGQNYNAGWEASITSGSTTNYVISGLNNGTPYTVQVIATKTGANDGLPSVEMTGTPSPITPSVTFGPGSFTASEHGATARVTVELSVPAADDITIPLRVQHRNGASSADYSGVPRRLIFEDGTTIRSFTITAVDDSDNDDDEKIRIDFKDLPAGFQAGARSSITVKLKDNDGGNSLPRFDPANDLRYLFENTAPNQDVGLPITATDADGDSLTYTFDGPDMDRFTFVPSTAQIQTKSGQTYDYETHQLFVVQVTADDGNGGTKTATVVIRVRDVAEPPQAPTGLTLVQAYPTSMALSWTPPDNTGRPAITGYDLQYKKSTESAWTAGPQGLTDTSDSITGLDPSTSYHVQVRANNDEGNEAWSSTLSRSTPSSSPGISITRTNLTMTEGDQTGRIYLIVLGSEPTADVHVYFSGYDATTVAPHNRSKTFNTGNWDAPRQVTLRAIEDADTTDETVTITHRVESEDADYEGITVPDLTVNVIDNDTPQVTGVWTQPGDRQLTVNWTATDKATGYKVQWKAPGDNYNTYGRMATITSGSTTTYTIPNLTNGTEYTVLVTATWTGHSDGQASDAVTGTPTATP